MVLSDTGCQAAAGDPANRNLCQRGEWQERMRVETGLAMLTVGCHVKQVRPRGWESCHARRACTMAACTVRVPWHGFLPKASGFGPLSMAELSLSKTHITVWFVKDEHHWLLFACRSIPPYSDMSVSSSGSVVGCHITLQPNCSARLRSLLYDYQ